MPTEQSNKEAYNIGAQEKGELLLDWDLPEYQQPERSLLWYVVAGVVGTLLLIYAIIDGNFLFAVIIILFAFIIFTQSRNQPPILHFGIYERGVQVGKRFYLFRELESFAVIYEPPDVERLYITTQRGLLRKELSIPLQGADPLRVRSLLLDYVVEDIEREEESGGDTVNRILKL